MMHDACWLQDLGCALGVLELSGGGQGGCYRDIGDVSRGSEVCACVRNDMRITLPPPPNPQPATLTP